MKDEVLDEEIEELRNKETGENLEMELEIRKDLKDCTDRLEKQERMAMLLLEGDKT